MNIVTTVRMVAVLFLLFCLSTRPLYAQLSNELVVHAISFAMQKLQNSVSSFGDSVLYPRSTLEDGKWKTVKPADWTSGFFPGCLWYGFELSDDKSLKSAAEKWTAGLESQQFNAKTHDVGFIMYCSYGNAYRLHPNEHDKNVLFQSARTLARRYNENVGCIRSWDFGKWQFPVIIDNMMNLELLFWAAKNGGEKQLYNIAASHAATTMKNHFRADGSTYHVVDYDTLSGEPLAKETHQGYASESVWARGQAWAMYGFSMAYRETNDERFLITAERAANWFVSHLPEDFIPYWDFNAPSIPDEPRDASAAAIATSALLELSSQTKDPKLSEYYIRAAGKIISSLCKSPYLSEGTHSAGVLNHATGNWPAKSEIDVSLIYGDYYFLETLNRFKRMRIDK